MAGDNTKTFFLFDANSLVHRAFHALPPLTTPQGAPIQAVYGLASILIKLWREERPDFAVACFDRPEPTFRKERYEAYKAQRPAAPQDLVSQIIESHHLFEAFGVRVCEAAGWEADDIIATFAAKFSGDALRVVILTGDMDTLQLVDDGRVVVKALKRGVSETILYDEAAVRERYGLLPKQLVDYKALVGDPSDNIKGVPGVGPKTAAAIIAEYGTIENVYRRLGDDKKLETRLGGFKKEAELSKFLVTLRRDAPIPEEPISSFSVVKDSLAVAPYFKKLGFETLLKRFSGPASSAGDQQNGQQKMF